MVLAIFLPYHSPYLGGGKMPACAHLSQHNLPNKSYHEEERKTCLEDPFDPDLFFELENPIFSSLTRVVLLSSIT